MLRASWTITKVEFDFIWPQVLEYRSSKVTKVLENSLMQDLKITFLYTLKWEWRRKPENLIRTRMQWI